MSIQPLKYLSPVLQPLYRAYFSRTRPFRYGNIRIRVEPGVFYPGFIFSTKILLQFIGQMELKDKKLLELGAGSGIISLYAASRGAIVTASDINPTAVENIRENANRNNIEIEVIESDLFRKIPEVDFDFIIIAPPYYPKDPGNYAEMAWFCGKDHEYFQRLFEQLPDYYHPGIKVYMILSEDCNIQHIKYIGEEHGFRFDLVLKKKKIGEWNYIFGISRND